MSFKRLDAEDLVISADSITYAAWDNNTPTLESGSANGFFTSSTQTTGTTGDFYYNVYNSDPQLSTSASIQFSIAYADAGGSGSTEYNALVTGSSPSRGIYGQYRTLVLGDENGTFVFGDYSASYFFVVSPERSVYRETLLPAGWNLQLSGSGIEMLHLTDNSKEVTTVSFNDAGRVYQIISGSNGTAYSGTGYSANSGSYGLFLPDISTLILNAAAISGSTAARGIELEVSRSINAPGLNNKRLYTAISGGAYFKLNSQETLTSDYVFIRARNSEFNYTENPSYISGSSGDIIYTSLIDNPETFITTVGLYNDGNELLAVAKLSRPLQKDFTKELLVRVMLNF